MKTIVEICDSDLKEIEQLISKGKITSIPVFISMAIRNQIMMEDGQLNSLLLETHFQKEEKPITTRDIQITSENVQTIHAPSSDDKFPFWATQNKYLCLKQITRDFAQVVQERGEKWIRFDIIMNRLIQNAIITRQNFESIDKHFHRGRGEKFSTGFPKNDSKSTSRYEKQFIGGIDGNGNKYGLAVEIGFLDVRFNDSHRIEFALTEIGFSFSKLESPIFGKNISNLSLQTHALSDDEIEFILSTLKKRKYTEVDLMLTTMEYIRAGKNRPEDGAPIIKAYLDTKYPEISRMKQEGCFSLSEAETIRAGVISRMNELNLINIEKHGLKSQYKLTKTGENFIKNRRK